MKICLICEYFYPDDTGGTGTVLSNLARHLKDEYPDVSLDVITSKNQYRGEAQELPSQENWDGIKITRLQTPKSNRPSAVLRLVAGMVFTAAVLRRLMRHKRYDLVFIVTNPPTLPMAIRAYKQLRGTPYIYLIHDLYPNVAVSLGVLADTSFISKVFSRLQYGWLHGAHRVVVLGRCMRDYLVESYHLPPEQVEVVTNWSDGTTIQPQERNSRFRRQNGLDGFVVLYAGNFGQYQNFDCILEAAKQLQSADVPITFVFVGEGARKEDIASAVGTAQLVNVRMFPFVPKEDFADLLASADVSLVTLEPGAEGLGVPSKFYNILASGRPTVAIVAPSSEVARVIEESGCGVAVPQGDGQRLAKVLQELVAAPERVQQMGECARRVFEDKYTLAKVAAQYHSIFEATRRSR